MEHRLEARFDARLQNTEDRLTNRFDGKLDTMEQRILDQVRSMIHDSETRLLGAFYSFAESNQKRVGDSERDVAALKERLGILETRLTTVEKRLNMPPAA